jgi:hypothetical protein
MKIEALRLFNVKRFAGRGVAIEGIGDGVNVLCAANEFGKSTSFEALHALFFQPHSGTPGDVQRLRPYSGGNPLIEADIATAEGQFRLTKQYYGRGRASVTDLATGRLVAQADEAEAFITNLVRGGASGPAGLLWVRQGMTGIERRTKSEEESEKMVRAGLLESVQGEVEAVTGGRRMAEILQSCEEDLSLLVTSTGKPKSGGRYADAVEAHERLVQHEQWLAKEVSGLRNALDQRAAVLRRLKELEKPADKEARRKAVERAQTAVDAASAQGERLRAAAAELGLASERRDAGKLALTAFRGALAEAERLRVQLQATEQQRAEALGKRGLALDAIEKASAQAEAAERAEQEARQLLARLDAALKAREMADRLTEARQRLSDAEAVRTACEEKETDLALLKMPATAVDELQALEVELARLRAIQEAHRPTVSIDYDAGVEPDVTIDGQRLAHGQERSYDGQARLAIPGVGLMTLRSHRPPREDKRLEQIESDRLNLLAVLGVDDFAAAQARQVGALRATAELEGLRHRLRIVAPDGLPALRESVARLGNVDLDVLELKEDPDQVRDQLAGAERRRAEARDALRAAQPARTSADEAFVAAETLLASIRANMAHVDAVLGPASGRGDREGALAQTVSALDADVAGLEASAAELRRSAADLETVEAALRRAKSAEDAATQETNTLREAVAELNGLIRKSADEAIEEEWRETVERRDAAALRVHAFQKEVAVLDRLRGALQTARSAARDLYLKPVMSELRPLLELLFDDVSVTFDEKTLLPQTILRNGQQEDVDRLSGGMREQLSVLTRLAFARLLARDGRPTPLILDDALVYSDDDRIERMFDALHRQSRDQQILVFSCRQRAFLELGGRRLEMVDWQPQAWP